jgi:hypothetical protein
MIMKSKKERRNSARKARPQDRAVDGIAMPSLGPAHRVLDPKVDHVNHHLLAAGAIVSVLVILLLFDVLMTPPDPRLRSLPSTRDRADPVDALISDSSLDGAAPIGISVCRTSDVADCTDFCSQVNLELSRCIVKRTIDPLDNGKVCACTKK